MQGYASPGICISQDIHRHLDIELAYFFLRENIGAPNGSDADVTEVRVIRSCFDQAHQDDCILLIQQGFQKKWSGGLCGLCCQTCPGLGTRRECIPVWVPTETRGLEDFSQVTHIYHLKKEALEDDIRELKHCFCSQGICHSNWVVTYLIGVGVCNGSLGQPLSKTQEWAPSQVKEQHQLVAEGLCCFLLYPT